MIAAQRNSAAPEQSVGENADRKVGQRILACRRDRLTYRVRLASCSDDVRAAQTLRFLVFNLELNEGLDQSFVTCRDSDPFDEVCDHLLIETEAGEVVGTYRLQTGISAGKHLGYYSGQEFDFTPFESARSQMIELGRACVHLNHRNLVVLSMLWKGIADYARAHQSRYLIGCSSLSSQDPALGAAVYGMLTPFLPEPAFRTVPLPTWACPMDCVQAQPPKIPKLLGAYVSLGARICGPPALDPVFKTIDFLTMLDLDTIPPETVRRYLS